MKYILTRILILALGTVAIYYTSDYIQARTIPEAGGYNFEGVIWFFRLLLLFIVISLLVFAYEAYAFNRQGNKSARNRSLLLIAFIITLVFIAGGYFLQFVF